MFDLDTFDEELARRFRKPERRWSLALLQSRRAVTIAAIGTTVSVSALVLANATALSAAEPVAMTSDMTYQGMTIEDFATEMGISIYDPYVLVLFEDLCMAEEALDT